MEAELTDHLGYEKHDQGERYVPVALKFVKNVLR
jgi:hypothetical protein